MDGATVHAVAGREDALVGVCGPRGQQRGMDVEHAALEGTHEFRREDAHVARQHDEFRVHGRHARTQRELVRGAVREVVPRDCLRDEAPLARAARRVGLVGRRARMSMPIPPARSASASMLLPQPRSDHGAQAGAVHHGPITTPRVPVWIRR